MMTDVDDDDDEAFQQDDLLDSVPLQSHYSLDVPLTGV